MTSRESFHRDVYLPALRDRGLAGAIRRRALRIRRAIALDLYTMIDPAAAALVKPLPGALTSQPEPSGNLTPRGHAGCDVSASLPPVPEPPTQQAGDDLVPGLRGARSTSATDPPLLSRPASSHGGQGGRGPIRKNGPAAGLWRLATLAGVTVGLPLGYALAALVAAVVA